MSLELPVYLIDDDDSVRRSLRFMLESYGLKIIDFDSAEAFFYRCRLNTTGLCAGRCAYAGFEWSAVAS